MGRRIETVDSLRGLAALAVCWFHFTDQNALVHEGLLKSSGKYGWAGVEVFFVISGFIIPYSLHRGGYRLSDVRTFLAKRITRLDPPYLVSIALVLLVGYGLTLAPGYRGEPFRVEPLRLLLHLGYLNVLVGYEWLNPVYWTLAIEFQYYLLVCVAFPLIASRGPCRRWALFAVLALLAWKITFGGFIFHFVFLFMMGVALFQRRVGISSRREFLIFEALFVGGAYWMLGAAATAAGVFALCAISFLRVRNPVLTFLGTISYSLYLVHPPVARFAFTVGRRYAVTDARVAALLCAALALTILSSYALYLLVERPSQRWSSSFKYRRARAAQVAEQTSGFAPVADEAGATAAAVPETP